MVERLHSTMDQLSWKALTLDVCTVGDHGGAHGDVVAMGRLCP